MNLRNLAVSALISAAAMMLGAGSASARHYDERCHSCGTVVGVEHIHHKDKHLGAGTAIGAIAGGVLGNQVGKGDGRKAATVAGAVAGGAIGHKVEKDNRAGYSSWRFRVEMDNGRHVTITQRDNPDIREGDRVRVRNGYVERY